MVLWLYFFLKANFALHIQYMQTFSDLRNCWLKLKISLFGSELHKDYLVRYHLLLGFTYSDKKDFVIPLRVLSHVLM